METLGHSQFAITMNLNGQVLPEVSARPRRRWTPCCPGADYWFLPLSVSILQMRPYRLLSAVAVRTPKRPARSPNTGRFRFDLMEATTGFEPVMGVLQFD